MNIESVSLYEQYDFSGMEEKFEFLFPTWDISFKELVLAIMNGNGTETLISQAKEVLYMLTAELDAVKLVCVTLLLIGIISTVFMNFSGIFPNQQIGNFGYKFTYLIMIIFLVKVNAEVFSVAKTGLDTCAGISSMLFYCCRNCRWECYCIWLLSGLLNRHISGGTDSCKADSSDG